VIPKGIEMIKGLNSISTRPGLLDESRQLLMLYRLSVEKEKLTTKLLWNKQQKEQLEQRLAEIAQITSSIEKKTKRALAAPTPSALAVTTHSNEEGKTAWQTKKKGSRTKTPEK
jgi:hypothetical protein